MRERRREKRNITNGITPARGLTARDRIVRAAMDAFATRGYEATSIADILARAKVNSGSLYFQFRSKEALLSAVLDAYLDGLWPMVMNPAFARTEDPIERVFAVLAHYRARLAQTDLTYTCPIGRLALEVGERIPAARKRIAANFAQWAAAIEQCLTEAGTRIPAEVDRAAAATFVLSVMEGAVMQAKTARSLAPFDAAIAQLRRYFSSLEREAGQVPAPVAPPRRARQTASGRASSRPAPSPRRGPGAR
jgi:TetR/AcrR family transcriptional repressor of nem operon